MHLANRSARLRPAATAALLLGALVTAGACGESPPAGGPAPAPQAGESTPPARPAAPEGAAASTPAATGDVPAITPIANPRSLMPAPGATLRVNGLLDSGFEWIADATTDPPKYGAYWLGAFDPTEGSATSSISEDGPFRGARFLRLSHVTPEAS